MGIDPISLLLLTTTAVGGATAYNSYKEGKSAAKARNEANRISGNQEQIEQSSETRRRVRARRLEAARLEQSADNSGVAQSSGEIGGLASLSSQTSGNVANASGQSFTNNAINALNQKAADHEQNARNGEAKNEMFQSFTGLFG